MFKIQPTARITSVVLFPRKQACKKPGSGSRSVVRQVGAVSTRTVARQAGAGSSLISKRMSAGIEVTSDAHPAPELKLTAPASGNGINPSHVRDPSAK